MSDEQQVIEIKKTVPEITTIYEFPGGNGWEVTRSTPDGVFAIGISKGLQSDNKTDVQTMDGAAAYYLANKDKWLEKWVIEAKNEKGEPVTRELTEGTQADKDKTELRDAAEAAALIEKEGLVVKSITTTDKKLIDMATIQVRDRKSVV